VVAKYQYKAVTVSVSADSDAAIIFIISNYEDFFEDAVSNGVYLTVYRDQLYKNWIDRNDLIFTWEQTIVDNGGSIQGPVIGSHKEAFGKLKDQIQVLRDNVS